MTEETTATTATTDAQARPWRDAWTVEDELKYIERLAQPRLSNQSRNSLGQQRCAILSPLERLKRYLRAFQFVHTWNIEERARIRARVQLLIGPEHAAAAAAI